MAKGPAQAPPQGKVPICFQGSSFQVHKVGNRIAVEQLKRLADSFPLRQSGAAASMSVAKTLQVSCVQMHWGRSVDRSLERTLHYIGQAADEGSRVVLFPEANLTSYYF